VGILQALKLFAIGFSLFFLASLVGYPLLAIVADISGSQSFNVGSGPLLIYRFTRDGASTKVNLFPLGLMVLSSMAGLLNLALKLLMLSAFRQGSERSWE